MKTSKTLISAIEEALTTYHGLDIGSAITKALAYVIFNCHCTRLVNYFDDPKGMAQAITPLMIEQAASYVVVQLKTKCISPAAWAGIAS